MARSTLALLVFVAAVGTAATVQGVIRLRDPERNPYTRLTGVQRVRWALGILAAFLLFWVISRIALRTGS
jgi:hypothetical protein